MKNIIALYKKWEGNKYFETIKVVVISLAIIIPIRTYLMEPFYVKGSSMEPNFWDYDYLLINKLKYRINEPSRQDIVIAKFSPEKPFVIKRIIGMPGDKVEITDKKLKIIQANGEDFYLDEPYLDPLNVKKEDFSFEIPEGEYLLMGDNRKVSYDGRQQGSIDKDHIKGKVMLKVLNFSPIADTFNSIVPFSK